MDDDYEYEEEDFAEMESEQSGGGSITAIPVLNNYQKTYASTMSNNDQKAIKLFKEYESLEKIRRLQAELLWVSSEQVYWQTLDTVIGKKRKSKYKSYSEWAKLMLIWLDQAKR